MPRRPGGLDPAEIDEALAALGAVTSREELDAALDRVPALSTPMLHAILRQQYLELQNAGSPNLANFAARYRDLFLMLHERSHRSLVMEARKRFADSDGDRGSAVGPAEPFLPPFWAAVRHEMGDTVPADRGPLHDPAGKGTGLSDELRGRLGRDVALPGYEPTPGVRWNAVVVGCGACDRPRLDIRAYIADLVVAPSLAEPLRAGRINASRCAVCGEVLSYPIRVWIMEEPGPGDTLATLSCVWRLAPDTYSYQPPPGTPRDEAHDRILEVRFQQLFTSVPWPDPEGQAPRTGPVNTTISVSYSTDELVHYLDRVSDDAGNLPFAMETMVRDMTRKVESGILPLHQAMAAVEEQVALIGGDWPVLHPGTPRQWAGPPLAHLFQSLIAEGVLRAQGAGADARAMFAGTTAASLLALGESALAETALVRAEDCVAAVPAGHARDLATLAIADIRADLLEFLGRYDEVETIRERLRTAPELQRSDLTARFAQQGLASQEALSLFKRDRLPEALDAFPQCIAGWETLLEEAGAETDATPPAHDGAGTGEFVRIAQHSLSGDLANFAAVLMTLLEDLVVVQIASAPDLSDSERRELMASAHPDPGRAMVRVNNAFPVLERLFDGEISRGRLAGAADSLLRRALDLSVEVDGWEFAGVQAHRLAVLHNSAGDPEGAEPFAVQAVDFAARAGDHERVWTALAFLADRALQRGDGTAALDHLETSARHRIRHEVGLGHHTELLWATEALGHAAFSAVGMGGDPMRAILIVESLRAANTAASLVTGTPYQIGDGQIPEPLDSLIADREKLRIQLARDPDDAGVQRQVREIEAELDRERTALALRDPRFARWADATDVDVASASAMTRRIAGLGPNGFWLGALVTGDGAWCYAAGQDGAVIRTCELPDLAWLEDPDAVPEGTSWTVAALDTLADALLTPHAERIEALTTEDTVVISVSGPLQHVPFAALSWRGKTLSERAALLVVQGYGMFEAAADRPVIELDSFALVGAPERDDFDPLPGAAMEIEAIARTVGGSGHQVEIAKGTAATVSALTQMAADHAAVHIACHVLADPAPEHASQLMLSPDPIRGDSGDLSEDQIITGMAIRPGGFVNLAGCATGVTRESGAPLLGGLVPAFLLAGARTVVASLWPIADEPAARVQEEIYRQIIAGKRPAAALAAAQRRCRSGELGDQVQEPAVWAAYAAYGGG